jgi:hypothetical protein
LSQVDLRMMVRCRALSLHSHASYVLAKCRTLSERSRSWKPKRGSGVEKLLAHGQGIVLNGLVLRSHPHKSFATPEILSFAIERFAGGNTFPNSKVQPPSPFGEPVAAIVIYENE